MKQLIVIASMLFLVSLVTFSQEPEFEYYKNREIKTLLGHDRGGGGYCSFSTGYSNINNLDAIMFGGRFEWMASHSMGIGLGATGFINEFHYEPSLDRDVFLTGGYGGLYIEPILLPRLPIHLSFPILLGFGGISFISSDNDFNENFLEDSKAFLLIEPSAEVELNLTKFLRLAVGSSYRLPTPFNVGLPGTYTIDVKSIRTFSYTVTLKLGKF
jgi:hypothetical protein